MIQKSMSLKYEPSSEPQIMPLSMQRRKANTTQFSHKVSALPCRLISPVGVRWSCLRINKQAFSPRTRPSSSSLISSSLHSHVTLKPEWCDKIKLQDKVMLWKVELLFHPDADLRVMSSSLLLSSLELSDTKVYEP